MFAQQGMMSDPNGGSTAVCSVHGKMRTMQNLTDDGMGGKMCLPGSECGAAKANLLANAKPGDWVCQHCGDFQFSRNSVCRKCGASKPMNNHQQGQPAMNDADSTDSTKEQMMMMMMQMMMKYAEKEETVDPDMQMMMGMMQHMVNHVGNQSSGSGRASGVAPSGLAGNAIGPDAECVCSVHGKKRTLKYMTDDGMGGKMCAPNFQCVTEGGQRPVKDTTMKEGDWICPGCSDHQFARNPACRKCGMPKPYPQQPQVSDFQPSVSDFRFSPY